MPEPREGESQKEYVSRCIPYVLKEGTAKDEQQAAAICYSMYREKHNQDDPDSKDSKGFREPVLEDPVVGTTQPPNYVPFPAPGYTIAKFLKRCIPEVMKQGQPVLSAVSMCLIAWECWETDQGGGPLGGDQQGGDQGIPKDFLPQGDIKKERGPSGTGGGQMSADDTRELYMLDADCDHAVSFIDDPVNLDNQDSNKMTAVALIADRFYKGKFLPYKELEKAYKTMDGSYHDINHYGTSYPIDGHPNIEYIIGYQKNTKIDPVSKTMRTEIVINQNAPHYKTWQNFIDINRQIGRKPNISVSFWASNKTIRAKELPAGINYQAEGYKADDTIKVLHDLEFQALSTVFKGACDDTQGCGIMKADNADNEEKIRLELQNTQLRMLKEEKTI
jgi:hypothetical protein